MAENKVFVGEDGFIHNVYSGDQDYASVKAVEMEDRRFAQELRAAGKPVLVVADLRQMGKSTPDSRKAAREALDVGFFDRIAVTGGSAFLRHLSNFIITASRHSDRARWVGTEEEAAEWLSGAR